MRHEAGEYFPASLAATESIAAGCICQAGGHGCECVDSGLNFSFLSNNELDLCTFSDQFRQEHFIKLAI